MKSIITKTLLVLAISGLPFICDAQCENNTIKDLAKGGNKPEDIAKACNMSVKEVLAAMNTTPNQPPTSPTPQKLPQNTPLAQCGCWGPVNLQVQVPAQQCQSGYAVAQLCNAMCPAGGYMWHGVCG
ncbi:hypothetical protein [Klebsiella variicola]|uniref:hypothetical protein n=1 Tax=Klebsiella variicola TaxID=244366 RepID=UPI0010F4A75B|nr:hypothetical protein [Klebsiella variicola]HDZ9772052.1 hypothetical protein [Klebsiella variicola subsp. variicola]ELA0883967.1 hypothetical protein [Klebsiella variicola]ELA1952021.1 hypothetical protein [Klebsiella variicola]WKL59595.1 hypothetical protein QZN18_16255 [Klebsiella variicola]HCB9331649.1 hypothetical protein [Klebsiella variicola]